MACVTVDTATLAVQNKGQDNIKLNGGNRGHVFFPHHQHQTALEDCNLCHLTFPQLRGSVDDLKSQGKLKPKQVMNKLCLKCHTAKKKEGLKTGPTTCSKCHTR